MLWYSSTPDVLLQDNNLKCCLDQHSLALTGSSFFRPGTLRERFRILIPKPSRPTEILKRLNNYYYFRSQRRNLDDPKLSNPSRKNIICDRYESSLKISKVTFCNHPGSRYLGNVVNPLWATLLERVEQAWSSAGPVSLPLSIFTREQLNT